MVSPRRTIDLFQRVALLLLSLAVSGLVAEAVWRLVLGRDSGPPIAYDAVLGWRFEPNTASRHRGEDFDVEVRIDDAGHRIDTDQAMESGRSGSGSGGSTIAFVGDSLTFGWGVEAEESFPSLVGRMLDVEVVNLGVNGYGTDQEYLALRRDGLPLVPETVVLTFCHNDLEEVLADRRYGWTKPRFRFAGERLVLCEAGERAPRLERFSLIYRSTTLYLEHRTRAPLEGERRATARRLVRRLIRAMAEASRRAGARFVVSNPADPWLASVLAADGVEQVDVGATLSRAATGGKPVIARDRLHWNARGHRAVADSLARALKNPPTRTLQ